MPSADEFFHGSPPLWLRDFANDPVPIVREALESTYYFGPLNTRSPADILLAWLGFGIDSFTAAMLDDALVQAVEAYDLTNLNDDQRDTWVQVLQLVVQGELPRSLAYVRKIAGRLGRIAHGELLEWCNRMNYMVIRDPLGYHIQPEDIDTRDHIVGFYDFHRENVVGMIVDFCWARGTGWGPVTLAELSAYYDANHRRHEGTRFSLHGLDALGYLVFEDGAYWFTGEFVNRAHMGTRLYR